MKKLSIKDVLTSPKIYIAIGLFILSQLLTSLFTEIIEMAYPDRVVVDDLLFDLTPHVRWMEYATDIILGFATIILIYVVIKKHVEEIPLVMNYFSITVMLRAFIMVLTPLGRPTGNDAYFSFGSVIDYKQHGMYPSGHLASSLIILLVLMGYKEKNLSILAFVLFILEFIAMILSRGHYTIDIVGGVMLAYIVYITMQDYKDLFIIKKK